MDMEYFLGIMGLILGLSLGLLFGSVIQYEYTDKPIFDAVCKDKFNNTEIYMIKDGNIVCKSIPIMNRLDHTNNFIYIDDLIN